jgi:hypothetical protein
MRLLLENGAEVDLKDTKGRTPLSWAASRGHESTIQLLGRWFFGPDLGSRHFDFDCFEGFRVGGHGGHGRATVCNTLVVTFLEIENALQQCNI